MEGIKDASPRDEDMTSFPLISLRRLGGLQITYQIYLKKNLNNGVFSY